MTALGSVRQKRFMTLDLFESGNGLNVNIDMEAERRIIPPPGFYRR